MKIDRRSRGLSPRTIRAYGYELTAFARWLISQNISSIDAITPVILRVYLLHLATHRNPGGCHIAYRVIKTLTYWWEVETDGAYRSPVRKVHAPKVVVVPLKGVSLVDIKSMLDTFGNDYCGIRNRAILLTLLDTGCRAAEFLDLLRVDLQIDKCELLIRHGKGNKFRVVFFGSKTRRAIRKYLSMRNDHNPALWVTDQGDRMNFYTLQDVVRRAAERAGIPRPGLHDFRRAFALSLLRSGVDLVTIKRLLGHSSLAMLERYLAQNSDDLQSAYNRTAPTNSL